MIAFEYRNGSLAGIPKTEGAQKPLHLKLKH